MKTPLLLVAVLGLLQSACVEVTFGDYPEASGAGVETRADSHAGIQRLDYSVDVSLDGFDPDWALVGVLIPIVPIGPWKWMGFVPKSELRVDVRLALSAKGEGGSIVPGSARILVGSTEYRPTEVRIAGCDVCTGRTTVRDPKQAVSVITTLYLQLLFSTCPPPDQPFALEISGLPRIEYTMVSHTHAGFVTPESRARGRGR